MVGGNPKKSKGNVRFLTVSFKGDVFVRGLRKMNVREMGMKVAL